MKNRVVDLSIVGKQFLLDLGAFIAAKHPAEQHKLSIAMTDCESPVLEEAMKQADTKVPDAMEDIYIFYVRDARVRNLIVELLDREVGGFTVDG